LLEHAAGDVRSGVLPSTINLPVHQVANDPTDECGRDQPTDQ
jgi:hypothetical protein